MVDARRGPPEEDDGVRRLVVLATLVTVAMTGCTPPPSAVAPPTEAPHFTPIPGVEPQDAAPLRGGAVEEVAPSATPQVLRQLTLVRPAVTLDRRQFPIGPVQGFVPASGEATSMFAGNMAGIARSYGELLTKYANLARLTQQEQESTRQRFESMHVAPRYVEILRGWLAIRGVDEEIAVEIREIALERAYAKPWGPPALIELHFVLVDRHTSQIVATTERERNVRLRMSVAGDWQVVDVFDATAGRWLEGDAPRYSALSLENEISDVIGDYLLAETYTADLAGFTTGRPATTFWSVRNQAIGELGARVASGELRDRHFEDVGARIVRFDPATFLGDGVLTVMLQGKLVETRGDGVKRTIPFTQALKFLRTYSGRAGWTAVDAQEPDGTWVSGGELALSEVDRSFG
jgi:hypothetical protein